MDRSMSLSKAWRLLPCSLVLACVVAALPARAQIDINSSPSVVGSGARALGMGGAFIAVADDATAASWNPGGLTQLERPELSIVYSWKCFGEEFPTTSHISPDGSYEVTLDDINYLSFVYPIPRTLMGRNLVLSLNYQRKYDFDRSLDFRVRFPGRASTPIANILGLTTVDIDYEQKGGLSALSPAFGFELTDRLSLGVAMNIWDSSLVPDNEWRSSTKRRSFVHRVVAPLGGNPIFATLIGQANTYEKYEDVEGINYTFGVLYRPTERLSLGAVYHTAYSTDVKYTRIDRLRNPFGANFYKSKIRIEWPGAIGVGAAYRFPNDKLTLSLDVTRRNWDRFVQSDPRQRPLDDVGLPEPIPSILGLAQFIRGDNERISPITGMSTWRTPHLDPTYTVRLGAEYVFVNHKKPKQNYLPSLRAGIFYDPEPASGRRDTWWGVSRGDGDPDDYYGFALGAGVLIKNRVNIDLAYQYRWGTNVRKDTLAGAGLIERGFSADVEQHLLYLSTVIYF